MNITPPTARRLRRTPPFLIAIVAALLLLVPILMVGVSAPGVGAAGETVTNNVAASTDDARSDDLGGFSATEEVALVGVGNGRPNVNGYRFANVNVPAGAIIDSVAFSLVKQGTQWQQFRVDLAFEASDNVAPFSAASAPAARTRTTKVASIADDIRRTNGTRYTLGDQAALAGALQEVVNRPGWQAGNSVGVIAYGEATSTWSRLSFYTVDAGAKRAPRLVITYHLPTTATPVTTTTSTTTTLATTTTTQTTTTLTTTTATTSTAPVAGQPCPAWVHDRYAAQGPDGRAYPTWHPPTDSQYGCHFGHEHGDDPNGSPALRGRPVLFGYAAAKAGMTEPHAGFKVFRWEPHTNVINPTSSTTAYVVMVLHQGSAGTARFTNVFHSAQYHYWNPVDGREVHVDMLAPFGKLAVGCGANDPNMVSIQQANVPGMRQVSAAQCFGAARYPDTNGVIPGTIPYEDWLTALYVGKDASGNWKAYIDPHFALFNPNTYCIPAADFSASNSKPCELGYSDVRAGHGIDPASTASEFKGVKREAYLNQVWLNNAGGQTTIWTDPYGNLVAPNAPNGIAQYVSAVSFNKQDGSNAFGADHDHDPDGSVHAPN